ncbi:hypothetical protein [Natronoglomus mannanivorans]|uniref:Uncharacterized protein n=1 Tax=Natronoglomus mannanivorans TaxID=2979990 RepID=A0AAP3E4T5_9EURY|nr:hypothetical protein [Halobacteria archaeon AArc-xg1-1]
MSEKLPSQAHFWGIREEELHVLYTITYWFNGKPVKIRGKKRRIATHHDLPLDDLFQGTRWDYKTHGHAHKRLLNNGLLQEKYVCRRKIDWAPTQEGRKAIRDVLKQWSDSLRPEWADEEQDGPLFGDPNEGVVHRKGVEIAARIFPGMPWAWSMERNGRAYGVEWYPTDKEGQSCHDLHIDTHEQMTDVGIEVITDSNNIDRLVAKWRRLRDEDRTTFWVFDRRETACRLWNELDYRGLFHLDGKFRKHGNWSSQAINRKIWRSSDIYRGEPAGDIVQTVTGLLEGDEDTIQDLFEEYYSTI